MEGCTKNMISNRIRELREARGLTQNALAERAGISATFLRNIEKGVTKRPSIVTLEALAGALRVPLSEITGEQEMGRSDADLYARIAANHGIAPDELVRILALFGKLSGREGDFLLQVGEQLVEQFGVELGQQAGERERASDVPAAGDTMGTVAENHLNKS
jgi:transcriptional regulator with XRE-family HTH domain